MTGEWCVSGAKDLRFIGIEFHMSRKRSCGMIDLQIEPGGNRWKGDTDDLRNGFCWKGLIFMSL